MQIVLIMMFFNMFSEPGIPEDVRVSNFTSDSIWLKWRQPIEMNGDIVNYTLKYKFYERECHKKGQIETLTITQEPNAMNYEIKTQIYPNWNYNISVAAVNKEGQGGYFGPLSITTKASRKFISTYITPKL